MSESIDTQSSDRKRGNHENNTTIGDSVKRRQRGPYRKWIGEQDIIHHVQGCTSRDTGLTGENASTASSVASSNSNHISDELTGHCDERDQPSQDDFPCPEYVHEHDSDDEILDELISELQTAAQQQHFDDLCDDLSDPLVVIADDITHAEDYTTSAVVEEESSVEDPPLFQGSRRHLGVVILLLCCFMIRYRLSQDTMHHLLVLLQLLLPEPNCLVASFHGIKQFLSKLTILPDIHYYCSHCYSPVEKESTFCMNDLCQKELKESGAVAYFVQLNIISQLQSFFRRKSFTETVRTHRFAHLSSTPAGEIRDVYDAELYQELYKKGTLSDVNSLSFAMNTDGVAIFKSSKVSMWPVYLLVNELPISERESKENMLLYGIWIAPKKPIMWNFLHPLYEDLKELETGVTFTDHLGIAFNCKCALLTCTCDLPAKCLVTNSIQFNGAYGCWHCLQPGETYRTDKGGCCHVYPFNSHDPSGPRRTTESVKGDVQATINKLRNKEKKSMTNGCKGPFWLMYLDNFNFVDGFVVDYMHGVCGGVMKLLLSLWFSSEHRKDGYSLYKHKSNVSDILKVTKPTVDITRVPRSLDDLAYWKASEFRNFLLYWGTPLLSCIMQPIYLTHFCLLVKAVYILSKESISEHDLIIAESCLQQFVKSFGVMYSLRYMTMNVHQLLHLTRTVRMTGPLFVNSCYIFEDLNGFIVSHIHGTQGVPTQIIQTLGLIHAMPILRERVGPDDEDTISFLDGLKGGGRRKCWKNLHEGIYRIDSMKNTVVDVEDFVALRDCYGIISSSLNVWWKCYFKISASYVYALPYKRLKRRNQSVIRYAVAGKVRFGVVKYFASVENDTGEHYVAVVNPFHMHGFSPEDSIHRVTMDLSLVAIVPLSSILCSCILVELESGSFICEIPNRYEKD